MMRGDTWTVVVTFTVVAFLAGIFTHSESASGLTGELAGLFGSLSTIVALCAFVAAMAFVVKLAFGTGGGF